MQPQPAKKKSLDMTSGSIVSLLITFSIPLLIGNLFQQLYNTVDSLIVGNFVGKEALAAVGSTGPLINTLITLFNGISVGATVIIGRYFGAKNDDMLHKAVETTLALTFIGSVICTFVGIYAAPMLLRFMDTPDDVIPAASVYLRIYFAGVAGLLVYNMGSGILRAVGDTKRPLYFLMFSSVMNIVLDLVFVIVFQMGIAGVAYATILSQFISAILVLTVLSKSTENYRFVWKDLCLNPTIVQQIFVVGLPTGLQQALTSFSNVYVQSYINGFGSSCMAGWSCYSKIDAFVFLPMMSMAQATTTFASQNIGANDLPRAKKGTRTALIMCFGISLVLASLLWIAAPQISSLFTKEEDVLDYAVLFLRTCIMFFVIATPTQILSGTLRGAGDAKTPMFIMLFSYVLFRQIYLYIVKQVAYIPQLVALGYPAGWFVCSVLTTLFYLYGGWEKKLQSKEAH